MRTLVVSDFHLGARVGHDVLRACEPRRRLLAEVARSDRLVLLGDVVELAEGRPDQAMAVAEPVLREIGAALGPAREVVLVPGNHDRRLVAAWLRMRGTELGLDETVPLAASRRLERIAGWLRPATLTVRYPGVWLTDRIWATHGHYLDRHLIPMSTTGIGRGLLRRAPRDRARPGDYERGARVALTHFPSSLTRVLPRVLAGPAEGLLDVLRAATVPRLPTQILPDELAPVTSRLLALQLRYASVPAMARVAHRLELEAEFVIFGHVHRLGPLAEDLPAHWRGPQGRPAIVNTGSWVYEPRLLHGLGAPHPYWPGGAVRIDTDADGTPQPVALLDDLQVAQLSRSSPPHAGRYL